MPGCLVFMSLFFSGNLTFKVSKLNKQVDTAVIKDLVASGGVHE